MIKLCDVVGYKNRMIYQDTDSFCFSIDSVLLSNFVTLNKSIDRILDIGTGTAIIPLILSLRCNKHIDAVEIQSNMSELAMKSIDYNKLNKQISVINEDILDFSKKSLPSVYDVIVSNPPYYKTNSVINKKSISRSNVFLNLEDVLKVSKKLLKDNGKLAIVYRTDCFFEVLNCFEKYGIMPKKIQFVYNDEKHKSKFFLLEGIKNGKKGIEVLNPFYIKYNNEYTMEYKNIIEKVVL